LPNRKDPGQQPLSSGNLSGKNHQSLGKRKHESESASAWESPDESAWRQTSGTSSASGSRWNSFVSDHGVPEKRWSEQSQQKVPSSGQKLPAAVQHVAPLPAVTQRSADQLPAAVQPAPQLGSSRWSRFLVEAPEES
jgi:hypothetical protein